MHKSFISNNEKSLKIIADIGLTCGGDLKRSLELIDIAGNLGVDAVKFQMINAEELLGDKNVTYTYPTLFDGDVTENMYEMFLRLEFTDDDWVLIKERCDSNSLDLIVTAHVESAVDRLNKLNLSSNKICTWSLNHYRMIRSLAKNGKPLIIDTGTINLEQLIDLEKFYKKNGGGDLIVLFDFHTKNKTEINFLAIKKLISLGFHVGYTPQGREDWLDYMAIGLGTTIIEKRLTLSRGIKENGHWKALEPDEFKEWQKNITECFSALGDEHLKATSQDIEDSKKYYKSAWLLKDVYEGESILESDFEFKRPGIGVGSDKILKEYCNLKYKRAYKKGEMFEG